MIGADALSRHVDWTDRGTCILFGDAAGAVVVQVMGSILFPLNYSRHLLWINSLCGELFVMNHVRW